MCHLNCHGELQILTMTIMSAPVALVVWRRLIRRLTKTKGPTSDDLHRADDAPRA